MNIPHAHIGGQSHKVRKFSTGATRDTDADKLDFDGFICPLVEKRFAQYMHAHRKQSDGTLRDSDNWTRGIPVREYLKSMHRHFHDLRLNTRGYTDEAREDLETSLCALLFNVQGYLHEVLKAKCGNRVIDAMNVKAHRVVLPDPRPDLSARSHPMMAEAIRMEDGE